MWSVCISFWLQEYLNLLCRCDPCGPSIAVIDDNGPPCVKMVHSKYLLLKECLNWQQAAERCNNLRSRLALPKSLEQNQDFLADAKNLDFVYGVWMLFQWIGAQFWSIWWSQDPGRIFNYLCQTFCVQSGEYENMFLICQYFLYKNNINEIIGLKINDFISWR